MHTTVAPSSPLAQLRRDDAALTARLRAIDDFSAAYDRDLIGQARSLAACDGPAAILAWISQRHGDGNAACARGAEYAAGMGYAAGIMRELGALAERLTDENARLRSARATDGAL